MNWYAGLGGSSVGGGQNRLPEGFYPEWQVLSVGEFMSGQNQLMVKVEGQVLKSDVPSIPSGTKADFVVSLQFVESAKARIKGFLAAALGLGPADPRAAAINERDWELAKAPNQPLAGHVVALRIGPGKPSKKPGGQPFHEWFFSPLLGPDGSPLRRPLQTVAPATPSFGVPTAMPMPGSPPPPPVAKPFPPPGWLAHPQAPGWFYEAANPTNMKQEAALRLL